MNPTSLGSLFRKTRLSLRFTIITIMFLSVLLGLLIYTISTLQKDQSMGFLIDVAGGQRMLLQKHINEMFLTSQGVSVDYTATRQRIDSRLKALMDGGSIVSNPETNQHQIIRGVPTQAIFERLLDQQNQMDRVFQLADNFLLLPPNHPEFLQQLKNLRAEHSSAIYIADQAVKELDQYAEATISAMVKWETLIALFVGILGVVFTRKSVRDGRKLEIEIEERKRAESALRDNEIFLNSIVENIPHMIFVKSAKDLRFVRLNRAAEELLDHSRNDLMGQTDFDMFPTEQAQFFIDKDREVLDGKRLVDIGEEPIQTKSNGLRHLTTKKIPLLDGQGIPQYLLGISEDITERKRAEERLRESEAKRIDALRQSDELKSALLASVSHELRTPLTAMKASVSSIMGNLPNGMDNIQLEFLKGIDQEINYLSRLVDNLLDMSQIEAGTLVPQREWHPLEDLVEGALRHTEEMFKRQNIEIHLPENIPPVYVDAIEIQQVLSNLFDNAAKYSSPDSPIRFHVHKKAQQLMIQISNEGDTIPEEDLEQIFDRFYRRRLQREQPIRGTGLGLAICKGIITAHGGQIWCESTDSQVTITFTLPATETMASFSLEKLYQEDRK